MRRLIPALLALAVVLPACDNGIPPAAVVDAFRTDGGPRDSGMDAPVPASDAAVDADVGTMPQGDVGPIGEDAFNGRDANFDAGDLRPFDAFIVDDAFVAPDTGPPDAWPPDDTSGCRLADGAYDLCGCGTFGADCASATCPSGQTCTTDPCGMHCVPVGAPCSNASDCSATSTCDGATHHCAPTGTGCGDSRDCAAGFACEAGTCVDRRIPCAAADGACPFGFLCQYVGGSGPGICVRQSRPCGTSVGCGSLVCVDVNGDGRRECNFDGTCRTNADCPGVGDVCAPRPVESFAGCGRYGPCAVANDCAAGMACVDLWGDGVPECVEAGGCGATPTSCPTGQVCATPLTGGPPQCLSSGG